MICTFYSYKGGVGRTMALANIAELFYQSGSKVLMIDWDLEAPGLERFFPSVSPERALNRPGLIDMLIRYKDQMAQEVEEDTPLELETPESYLVDVYPDTTGPGKLFLLTAGRRSQAHFKNYAQAVLGFDWQDFYKSWGGELYFNWLRDELEKIADIILIDSRTGVTEMGGVCTYHLADTIVMLCTPSEQAVDGTYAMAQNLTSLDPRVQSMRCNRPLNLLIIPARIERAEGDLLDEFQQDYLAKFTDLVPQTPALNIQTLWQLRIPYIPKYAYREMVAVRETGRASAEDMEKAFQDIAQVLQGLMESQTTIGAIEVPSGVVPLNSPFYIERASDAQLSSQLARPGTTITIRGARQTGKTSLLVRGAAYAREQGARVVHLDFQGLFDRPAQLDYDQFFRYLAYAVAHSAQVKTAEVDAIWDTPSGARIRLTRVIGDLLLAKASTPVVLVIDEADILLHTSFYEEFFGLLRVWHNNRAFDPLWTKLSIVLAISTHPSLLIEDVHQSPFNVGLTIYLPDFTEAQIQALNDKHGAPLHSSETGAAMDLLGGHPYLIRQALYTMACDDMNWYELAAVANKTDGPFGQHLRYYLELLQRDDECVQAARQILQTEMCPPGEARLKLESAGLVTVSDDNRCVFRYGLYKEFFGSQLI